MALSTPEVEAASQRLGDYMGNLPELRRVRGAASSAHGGARPP